MIRLGKFIPVVFIAIIFMAMLCGCTRPEFKTDNISGEVYLDGRIVSGAFVEAVSVDGADRRSTTTDGNGVFTLNIKAETKYNLTSEYQGFRHTVWPVYLPGDTNTYIINLTTTPGSTIEGGGYARGGHSPWADHMKWSGVVVNMTTIKDNKTLTALTDSDGRYSLEVEPDVLYNIAGASCLQNKYPVPIFHYRNNDTYFGSDYQLTVGPNETALIDYEIRLP